MGIDNAFVEIDNLEVPILDGSGQPFVDLIRAAGIRESRRRKRYLRIRKPVSVERAGANGLLILPSGPFPAYMQKSFSSIRWWGDRLWRWKSRRKITRSNWRRRGLSGFVYDLHQLRNMGLIRGASLDNAVCFDHDSILNPGGLRFPDECCRHKALDLIGDLALIGKPLLGHVIAEKAGHAMHFALVNKIMSDPTIYEIITYDQVAPSVAMVS